MIQWPFNALIVSGSRRVHSRWGLGASRGHLSTLFLSSEHGGEVEQLDPTRMHAELSKLVRAQEQHHEEVLERVTAGHARMRASAIKGTLPNSKVSDCVMVARVRKSEALPKLVGI